MALNKKTPLANAKKAVASKPEKKPSKALATQSKSPAIVGNLADQFEEDAGSGFENMTQEDFGIPRLSIVQDTSKVVKKSDGAYNPEAESGMIVDTVTSELFDGQDGIQILPIRYRRTHLEWKPGNGGFVRDHGEDGDILNSAIRDEKGHWVLPNKNTINITAEYLVFLLDGQGGFTPYAISMASTQLKNAKKFNGLMNGRKLPSKKNPGGTFTPPMFYGSYRMTTVPENGDNGSWWGWKIESAETVEELKNGAAIYAAAQAFNQQASAGAIKVSTPSADAGGRGNDDSTPM